MREMGGDPKELAGAAADLEAIVATPEISLLVGQSTGGDPEEGDPEGAVLRLLGEDRLQEVYTDGLRALDRDPGLLQHLRLKPALVLGLRRLVFAYGEEYWDRVAAHYESSPAGDIDGIVDKSIQLVKARLASGTEARPSVRAGSSGSAVSDNRRRATRPPKWRPRPLYRVVLAAAVVAAAIVPFLRVREEGRIDEAGWGSTKVGAGAPRAGSTSVAAGAPDGNQAAQVVQVTPRGLKQMIDRGEPLAILDVRDEDERSCSAIHVPLDVIELVIQAVRVPLKLGEVQRQARGRPIVVYCHHGRRSNDVAQWLARQGFSRVMNLVGGIDAWSRDVDPKVPRYTRPPAELDAAKQMGFH